MRVRSPAGAGASLRPARVRAGTRGGLSEKLNLFFYDSKSTLIVVSFLSFSVRSVTLWYNFVTPRV